MTLKILSCADWHTTQSAEEAVEAHTLVASLLTTLGWMCCDKMVVALIWLCILASTIFLGGTSLTGICRGTSDLLVLSRSLLQGSIETISETRRCAAEWLLDFGNMAVVVPLAHASRTVLALPSALDTTVDCVTSFLGLHHLGVGTDVAVGGCPCTYLLLVYTSEPLLCRLLTARMSC